jgi:hypothetical protein
MLLPVLQFELLWYLSDFFECHGFLLGISSPFDVQSLLSKSESLNARIFSSPLDKGIERAVHILMNTGVETFESCKGGCKYASTEPTVRFHG